VDQFANHVSPLTYRWRRHCVYSCFNRRIVPSVHPIRAFQIPDYTRNSLRADTPTFYDFEHRPSFVRLAISFPPLIILAILQDTRSLSFSGASLKSRNIVKRHERIANWPTHEFATNERARAHTYAHTYTHVTRLASSTVAGASGRPAKPSRSESARVDVLLSPPSLLLFVASRYFLA
jgi:hypothetical protein